MIVKLQIEKSTNMIAKLEKLTKQNYKIAQNKLYDRLC